MHIFGTTFSLLVSKPLDMKKTTTPPETTSNSNTLKERIQKHITDKNDVITDEDIKNIKIGEETTEEAKAAEEEAKAIEEKKTTSPWNVLSEEDK